MEILPSSIGISTEGKQGLRATVAAAVKTDLLDWATLCSFGLRTREGRPPFFMRSGDRRNSVMLASVLLDMFADAALSTRLCKYGLAAIIDGVSSSG